MAVSGQDIGLLFGVLGGGRINGESGTRIKTQLDSIVASLNNATNSKQRRIKLNLDIAGTKQSFREGLQQITGGLSGQKQFKIKVSEIDATSAINKLRTELDAMLRTIKVDTGFTVTLGKNGASSAMKEIANDAKGAVLSIAEAEAALKEISVTNQSLTAGYKKAKEALGGEAATDKNLEELEKLKQKYLQLQAETNKLGANKRQLTQEEVNQLYVIQAKMQELITQTMERVSAENALADAAKKRSAAELDAAEKEKAAQLDVNAMRKDALALQKRMDSALRNFSKASGTPWYQTISAGKTELDAMLSGATELDRVKLNNLIDSFNASEGAIRGAGLATRSLGDSIVANAKKFTQWFGVSQIIMRIIRLLKDMVTAVKEVDSAMTELRKVTNETEGTYIRFLEDASKRARALGATLADTVNATADFARLGYTLEESATLADAALVYKNVGDGIESIDDASASVISTMRAFNIEAESSMFIVDKFNEVGNNFAISSKGVGDALLRSASALAAGNNTLDESIGLITAANSVVQDADKVGTTLKTISMFLRAAKTEAEEAGESTEGMANSVSELRAEILALTGGKVDIQIDEDTFKSTYQIIKELSEVWGELTDISQANILEMIGGKRNSNVVAALLTNFQIAEDVVATSAEAAGSALAENEKYLDSIAGRISVFNSAFESMSQNIFESELVKDVVDLGTALVSVAGGLAKIDMLLPSIVAAAVTYKSFKLAQSVAQLAMQEEAAVASLVQRLIVEKATNDNLVVSYQTLNAAQQQNVLSKLQNAVASKQLSAEAYKQIVANLSLASATTGAKVATDGLNVSIKSLLASNPIGWIMLAISLIPTVINLVGSLHKSNEELIQDAEDLKTSYSNSFTGVAGDLSTLRGLEDEFNRLSAGVDDYGNNISLAADDYERYREIVSTILGISPSLVSGYDAEGNAIANKNGLLEKSIELMEEEQRLKMKEFVSDKNLKTVGMGEVAAMEEYENANPLPYGDAKLDFMNAFRDAANRYAAEEQGNYEGEIYDALNPGNIDLDDFWTEGYWSKYGDDANRFAQDYYETIVESLRSNRSILEDYFTQGEIDELLDIADEYDKNIEVYQSRIDEFSQALNPTLQYVPQTITAYSELTEGQKEFLTNYINNFRITADTTEEDILQMKQDILDFTEFLAQNDDLRESIDLGMSIKYGVDEDGNGLTVSDYKERVAELNRQIASYDEDMQANIKVALGIETDASEINADVEKAIKHVKNLLVEPIEKTELEGLLSSYQEELERAQELGVDLSKTVYGNIDTNNRQVIEWNNATLNQFKDAIMSWEDQNAQWNDVKSSLEGSFSTLYGGSNNFDGVEIAFSPILQTEDGPMLLSRDTLNEYINGLIDKAGEGWTTEKLLELDAEGLEVDGVAIKNMIADIGDTAIETGEAMHFVGDLGSVNTAYESLADAAENAHMTVDELNASIENGNFDNLRTVEDIINDLPVGDVLEIYYKISADPNSMTFEELQDALEKLGVDWSKTVNVWDFSTMVDGIGEIESGIGNLVSAMDSLREGTKLTKGELAKLALEYPELLKVSDLFADTTVENQQTMLSAILDTYEKEHDALIDTKIAELTATNQLIQDQIALENEKKNKVVEIADMQSNGKLDSERAYQEVLDSLHDLEGQNYVTFSDGILSVNQDMLTKELEQMGEKVEDTRPLFEAQGNLIAEANYKGVNEGLKAFPLYASRLASWAGSSFKTLLSNIGTNIGKAFSGDTDFVGLLDGIGGIGSVFTNSVTLETDVETKYTIDGKSVDEWSAGYEEVINKRVATLTEQIETNNTIIDNLSKLKGLDLQSIYGNDGTDGSKSGKDVEEYVADIERYREALERLNDVRIKKADLELELENAEDLDEQIRIEKELLGVYRAEQECLEEINGLRDETISNGVKALEQLGFQIDYDPDKNKFFVKNLEHLNDLTADSKGKYGSLQEATNALRKDTEDLIDTLEELNAENQEDQDTWQELYHTIREAKINIVNNLKEIVSQASEAVDSIQNVYDTLKDAADEYAANGGFISVDAFQKIVELGPEYMQYLRDENGLLVINEQAINRVIAAKTEQLALESAMSYIERIRLALQGDSIESLNTLLFATTEATNATWGLVYAELALMHQTGDLNDSQYEAAMHNINAIRSLAENAISGIGQVANTVEDNLTDMKQGLDDILKYVMDMLRHRIEQQIDALEEMKEAYGELIELKKESMEATKEETDYQDEVAEKVKQIAKLQERINALSLDDSRDAQAQKAQLQEEMAELQKELADTQADYAYETQQDSLDKMQEAYEAEKDKEIAILEESISSEQKLYEMAISYIQSNWDTLYQELIAWNTEYGSVLNSEITTAWDNCLAAAQRYGSYVSALNSIDADIENASNGSNNIVGGSGKYDTSSSNEESIHAIIKEMYANSRRHGSEDAAGKAYLNRRNLELGAMLAQYGITAVRGDDGVWYVNRVGGEKLYDKYKQYIYHTGGIVGDEGSLKENELLAKIEKGEVMVSNQGKGTLFALIEFMDILSKKLDTTNIDGIARPGIGDVHPDLSNITNNQSETIHFGDVYIYGADEQTVEKHREVNRQFTNEVLKQLNIKR